MDRVEPVHAVNGALDAIEADLDGLEAALESGWPDLSEWRGSNLFAPGHLSWTDEQCRRAAALLERNRKLAEILSIRMRETTYARQLLGMMPNQPRYLDTMA